ncbi:helicase-associated domain-containing protein [Paenibacillus paridis]|uniref:helicase-associated domain-containing protein n=1 Tax=Paenibacillus paridis TaxID=2583376 RepID=UPI00111E8789|nr:helicase-associated domain-containing protein [Paenibacillus paridis]
MRINMLLDKLSYEHRASLEQSPIWHQARERGMRWEEAAVKDEEILAASRMLPLYAAEVLSVMLRSFSAVPVESERLLKELRKHSDLSGAECQLGLAELEGAGVLFSVRKVWGERLYFMPLDSFGGWQRALFPCNVDPISALEREYLMNGAMRGYRKPLGRQLLAAFSALGRCGLALTASGTLPKKTVAKLMQAVDIDEAALASFDLKWPFPDKYPLTVAFILEAGFAFGLLEQDEGTLKWNEDMLSRWLRLDDQCRERELMTWVFAFVLPSSGVSAHLAAAMAGLEAGTWYTEQRILAAIKVNLVPENVECEQRMDRFYRRWFELWHNLGWLEIVHREGHGEREWFVRWKAEAPLHDLISTSMVRNEPPFVTVSPNGELMVEPECPFWVRWELALLAELKSDEQVAVYRLEAASVAQAMELGRNSSDIKAFLVFVSGGEPFPTAAESLLEVWTARACRTAFAEVTLLRCDNEEMAALVEQLPSMKAYLIQKLGKMDYIVERTQIAEIRQALKKTGYEARKAVQSEIGAVSTSYPSMAEGKNLWSGTSHTEERKRSTPAYLYEAFPLQHFELNGPSLRGELPAIAQRESVPAMWIKQLRAYHHSTRRELIEQALLWQTPVQLRIERELRSFVPEKLEQKEDGWAVIGLLRDQPGSSLIRLTPDMWEEMRLVIPGQDATI